MVKQNQPLLRARVKALPWRQVPAGSVTRDTGHGRLETRTVKAAHVGRLIPVYSRADRGRVCHVEIAMAQSGHGFATAFQGDHQIAAQHPPAPVTSHRLIRTPTLGFASPSQPVAGLGSRADLDLAVVAQHQPVGHRDLRCPGQLDVVADKARFDPPDPAY